MNLFFWPKTNDIQLIEKQFIFYGPINMCGTGPFFIKIIDRNQIIKLFKEIKKNLKKTNTTYSFNY